MSSLRPEQPAKVSRFLSIAQTATELGVDPTTVYRAVRAGEFPAVKVRGRYVIPARAIEDMIESAMATGSVVDVAEWSAEQAAERAAS